MLEQVEGVGREKLKQQSHIRKKDTECSEKTTVYGHVNQHMEKNISSTLHRVFVAFRLYSESELLPNDEAIGNLVEEFQKSIKDAKESKCMFSVSFPALCGNLSIIDYSILILHHLLENDENVTPIGRSRLAPLWAEISALVSKGNDVGEGVFGKLQSSVLEDRKSYLSTLKQIVSGSIENGDKKGIVVQKDNEFYCVKCPEESVITPAKFMNSKEFKNLGYGALQMGEGGNVIRIQNGQYYDMRGKVKMTFKVADDEKIEMILSSEKAESFGKMMVRMNDKSCEIFLKYREELEKEPRISKVVEAAKSFAQKKSSEVSPPLSNIKSADISQHSQSSGQSVSS